MSSGRLLRFINLSIAVLIVGLLAATYWYAWRPLAKTSGTIVAPVSARATVVRDAIGVAHIRAGTWQDAIFLQGYVTAQDRLWQMDALRRLAGGELAEIVGKQAVESDQDARRFRLGRIAEEAARTMPAEDRAVLAAYARGVNHFIETHRDRLPLEFTLLRYDPRPWSIRDSIAAGMQMYRTLTLGWRDEVLKQQMVEKGDRAKIDFLFPVRGGGEFQPGSNAWAISGLHTASGKPILANDTHLEFSLPATWYMIHLEAPGLNVSGFTLPGIPAVLCGHNERIAWGLTNLQFDVQDLYREKFDMQSGRYEFRGQWEYARVEREVVPVKGSEPVEMALWITRHGPISINEGGRLYALRWTAAEKGAFQFPFLELNRARNWTDFRTALRRFAGPGQNFAYADVDGNIGYQAAGMLPIRQCAGDLPADGWSGECEWSGFIPFDDLPSSFQPESGRVITANQNPFPETYKHRIGGNFGAPYRSRQIRDLLSARGGWKTEDMLAIQKDVYSPFTHFLAQQIVAAADSRNGANGSGNRSEAIDELRRWNGQMERGMAAPVVVSLAYQRLRKMIGERAAPGPGQAYDFQMASAAVERLLRERPGDWFSDFDAVLVRALEEGVEEGVASLGSKISRWDFGRFNDITIPHPVAGQLPLIGRYFNVGPVPMSGSPSTVKQRTRRIAPSMRMAVDLGDLEKSLANVTIGQSGQFLSPHYKDQWQSYWEGKSFPMQFRRVEAKATLVVEPRQ